MADLKMKPCPFLGCGGDGEMIAGKFAAFARCKDCYSASSVRPTPELAIAAWNSRTPDPWVARAAKLLGVFAGDGTIEGTKASALLAELTESK